MNLFRTARTIYVALKDDRNALDAIRAERSALALRMATDPNATMTVTSGTLNGQMFAGITAMKPHDRLYVLSQICHMDDNGYPASSTVKPYV